MLTAGVVAAPLFLLVSFIQMPLNPGFDLTRHAFSYLSIGDTGTIQQANFVVLGLLNLVAAGGLVSALRGKTRYVAAALLALNGLGQIIAGIFTLDPSNGFPIGAPDGLPETVSTHGNLHGLGFGLSIVTWVSLLVVLASLLKRNDERPWARACLAGAVALVVTGACLVTPFGTVLLYVVLTSTWLLTAAVLNLLRRW